MGRAASSAAPPRARASQVARSEAKGHGKRGRLFFAYFLLAKQKKVGAPPGAHPGLQRHQNATLSIAAYARHAWPKQRFNSKTGGRRCAGPNASRRAAPPKKGASAATSREHARRLRRAQPERSTSPTPRKKIRAKSSLSPCVTSATSYQFRIESGIALPSSQRQHDPHEHRQTDPVALGKGDEAPCPLASADQRVVPHHLRRRHPECRDQKAR